MGKLNVVCSYKEISFSLNKGDLTHATMWMNLKDIMLSGISQPQKDKSRIIPLI